MNNNLNNKPNKKLNRKQLFAIIAILVAGCLLAGIILLSDKQGAAGDTHAAEQGGHSETDSHDDEQPAGKNDAKKADAGHEHQHADGEHHEEEGKVGHAETVALSDEQIKASSISIEKAAAGNIRSLLVLPGEIRFNEDRTAHVVPRLAGVVQAVPASLGEQVKKGQVIAVIASTSLSEQRSELFSAQKRQALARLTFAREKKLWEEKISAEQDYLQAQQALRETEIAVQNASQKLAALGAGAGSAGASNRYEIRAPFDGIVIEKHIALGEAVKEDASIFTISDLSSVWAEIAVPAKDLNAVRVGEKVTVRASAFDSTASGKVAYVGSLLGEQTRTAKARVTLANPQGTWRPGLFVSVEIVAGEAGAAVVIAADALHSVEDKTIVFVKAENGFIAQPVKAGRSDGKLVEIVEGLKPGEHYAAAGSFVIKSELGKASAEHAH